MMDAHSERGMGFLWSARMVDFALYLFFENFSIL